MAEALALRVYLIPGFFGFSSIGRMRYFDHVHRALEAAFEERGLASVEFHDVPTAPTSQLEERARRLASFVLDTAEDGDELHLVGHSTGGLDARWVLSPSWAGVEGWADRVDQVRSAVGIGTPHQGAPLARYLGTAQGEAMLGMVSAATLQIVRLGPRAISPIGTLLKGGELAGGVAGASVGLLETVRKQVLDGFDGPRNEEIRRFFAEVRKDRSLIRQLQPSILRELSASLDDRPGVRYGSVVLRAAGRLASADRPGSNVFEFLHERARWQPDDGTPPTLPDELSSAPEIAGGPAVAISDTDGIVPTRSQFHGELVTTIEGDHLDAIGFFGDPTARPPHLDWLRSPPRFDRAQFTELWSRIAEFMHPSPTPGPRTPPSHR